MRPILTTDDLLDEATHKYTPRVGIRDRMREIFVAPSGRTWDGLERNDCRRTETPCVCGSNIVVPLYERIGCRKCGRTRQERLPCATSCIASGGVTRTNARQDTGRRGQGSGESLAALWAASYRTPRAGPQAVCVHVRPKAPAGRGDRGSAVSGAHGIAMTTPTRKQGPMHYRQGDVLLTPIATLPKGVTLQQHDGPAVLAYGEHTGHAHTVERGQLYTDGKGLTYLTVEELTELKHQEHGAIALEPGVYRVTRQREWTDADEPRTVAD